ncbi:MAG: hypothetical protein ACLRFJ_00825 [Alphaproteobacteria bacterium]
MFGEKKDVKKYLKIAGCSVAVGAGLVFLQKANEKQQIRASVVDDAANFRTELFRDTVDITVTEAGYIKADDGQYNMYDNTVLRHYFRDVSGTEQGKYTANFLNEQTKYNDYHEIRHAFNLKLQTHYFGSLTMAIEAVDEVSARMAAELAQAGGMTPYLRTGIGSPYMSYSISESYDLQKVVDKAFRKILSQLRSNSVTYENQYVRNSQFLSEYLICACPKIDENTLLNEMLTFDINGKRRNVLKIASKDVQKKVYAYINSYNKQR